HDSFKIIHEGVISGENLDRFLLDKIDVLVAMGTSALEGAKLGVPTVLLDFSYGNVPEGYRFRMLFESEYYGLADLIDDSHIETGNKSLEQIIENIQVKYSDLSEKTFDYCARNHSISSVCEKFMSALEEATFHYGDFNPEILKRGWIRKMYELVREK
ncbi:hypothetical protein, partial [Macellibacteroides fermentans]|uniref:hypothetical protein n=1 Tax=Macellibacteroides fermentans TaxID=879969 RepID=UPI00406D1E3F